MVAEGQTGPLWWDGADETLPEGIDAAIERSSAARSGEEVNTLCALAAESPRDGRRRGLAVPILEAMRVIAERHGLTHLVAPVRPLEGAIPAHADRALHHVAPSGRAAVRPLDARPRTARCPSGDPIPRSLQITGTVAEWESGPGWRSRSRATTSSPRGWPPSTSTGRRTRRRTGSRTSGWCTRTLRLDLASFAAHQDRRNCPAEPLSIDLSSDEQTGSELPRGLVTPDQWPVDGTGGQAQLRADPILRTRRSAHNDLHQVSNGVGRPVTADERMLALGRVAVQRSRFPVAHSSDSARQGSGQSLGRVAGTTHSELDLLVDLAGQAPGLILRPHEVRFLCDALLQSRTKPELVRL